MANRIQLRRDTTSNWNNVNPVLADGEPGYDIVTNELRIGDGSTSWSGLSGNTISGGGASTGNITFSDYTIIGTGNIYLQPDVADLSTIPTYLDVFVTTAGGGTDIHLVGGNSSNLILGEDNAANVRIGSEGNVQIQASPLDSTTYTWTFGSDGDLTLPGNGDILVDGGVNSAIRDLLQNDVHTGAANYTLLLSDRGKMIYQTGGYSVIVPAADGSTITFPVGTVITIVNSGGAGDLFIDAADGGTNTDIYGAGTDTNSDTWALPSNSIASLMKVEASGAYSKWLLSGAGIYDNT